LRNGRVQYYAAKRDGRELLVVSALGHLYALTQVGGGWTYPVYEMKWVPASQVDRTNTRIKAYIETISTLSRGVDRFVSACDYDQEGSLIAYNTLRYAVGDHSLGKSSRMLYSTLTRTDLAESWENMEPTLDYHVIAAGKTTRPPTLICLTIIILAVIKQVIKRAVITRSLYETVMAIT